MVTRSASPGERRLLLSLLISLAILGGCMWATWQIGLQANDVSHRLYHLTENNTGMRHHLARIGAAR